MTWHTTAISYIENSDNIHIDSMMSECITETEQNVLKDVNSAFKFSLSY